MRNMIKTVVAVLILFSSFASIYYAFGGIIKPETALVYNKANVPRPGIQLLSLFLGIGGLFLLFPQTFKIGGGMLITHSLTTIICFVIAKEWRGGFMEFIFLQIPVFLFWAGYPLSVLERLKGIF
jgi:hypothetical protein